MTIKQGLCLFNGSGPSLVLYQALCGKTGQRQWVAGFLVPTRSLTPLFDITMSLVGLICRSPQAESDPAPLCPQTGPKETDDTRQQTTLPV